MSEDPKHPWGSGATTHSWTPEVRRVVQQIERRFPGTTQNSYVCHPWCGWSRVSVDVWGRNGRGDSIPHDTGAAVLRFAMNLPGKPFLRHTIFEHKLWTSFGGVSYWSRDDHSGNLRHVHLTYWPD